MEPLSLEQEKKELVEASNGTSELRTREERIPNEIENYASQSIKRRKREITRRRVMGRIPRKIDQRVGGFDESCGRDNPLANPICSDGTKKPSSKPLVRSPGPTYQRISLMTS